MRIACVLIPRFPLAVELLARPELRGRPAVVGGAPDEPRTVVACSPEAEREGIHRGMQLRSARARTHVAAFLKSHPHTYRDLHQRMLDALNEISPIVEGRSPDSAFVGLDGLSAGAATSARAGGVRTIKPGQAAAFVCPLPIRLAGAAQLVSPRSTVD